MQSRRSRWLSGIGAVVLIGGLVVASYGSGGTPALAHNDKPPKPNPFQQILDKLDQILTAIGGISGGGGNDGNHTLRWDQNLAVTDRFVVLAAFNNQAVLDKNTGLVWEQAPDATTRTTWSTATSYCVNKNVGGTVGWRLPSVAELKSVQDPSLPAPFVPGSVFTGVQSAYYWSASTYAENPTTAWTVGFHDGSVGSSSKASSSFQFWCVCGGHNDGSEY